MEFHVNFSLPYQSQVASMVCEGTFVKYPNLRVVLLEAGFTWLPHVLWTLDAHWQSLQVEVPWLTQKPSRYIQEHISFGTQPIILPERAEHLLEIFEMIGADSSLLYASDYPHWDFDAPSRFLPREVPDGTRRRLLGLNALELYGFPYPQPRDERKAARASVR
jgi:predicted TIM-barrel fold metal-dependent hydrolase